MKCPKCNYLGFETGDRCKNCGYDFSLIDISPPDDVEVDLDLDLTLVLPDTPTPTATMEPAAALPLFTPVADDDDDEPLIKLPAEPRAPLAVRKTPETPRLRAVPRAATRISAEPVLEFAEPAIEEEEAPAPVSVSVPSQPGPAGARLSAAALDHLILASVDAAVVYLTLRMAGLTIADWTVLPLAPLATFLLLLKVSYFGGLTAIGGQTIGKMAMGLRVVTDDGRALDGACAIRRTLAGTVSTAALGLGFVPALIGSERRALHDHLARTRVVDLHT